MPDKKQLISFIQSKFPMPVQRAEEIAGYFHEKTIAKNEIVFEEGQVCKEYYFLEEGLIRSFTHDLDNNDVTTGFYNENNIACELLSFFRQIPSQESFQALSNCKTFCISYDDVQSAFHAIPAFREFGRAVLVSNYATLKQRMLSNLHQTADQRYAHLLSTNPTIFKYSPLKNIASYLGITTTSLSRIRKELIKSNSSVH